MEEILIPNKAKHDVATFEIMIEGEAISATYQILSLSVSKEINRVPNARLVILDGESADRQFEISNKNDFLPGNKIVINVGRDGDNNQVFDGVITKHGIKILENGNSQLSIECKDLAYIMTLGRKSHYFENVTDNQVFDDLIARHPGLKSDSQSSPTLHNELVQHHISDWDFMVLRAEAVGMLVNINDGTIKISKPDTSSEPILQIAYGSSILEFEAEMDLENQWKNVQAKSWDYETQDVFDAEKDSAEFTENGNFSGNELADKNKIELYEMHHSGHVKEDELQDWVDGIMLRSRLSKIRGRARFTGFATVKTGDMVEISGVGDRFNGNVYVTAVRHEVGHGMWDTHIQFGLNPRRYSYLHNDMGDTLAAGLVGGIRGLQIGKVVGLEGDPDGQDRILVKIPMIDNDAQGIWTRISSLDAGNDRGAFFMPEIGDEVIVGFINEDPRDAIVLGMLYSSSNPAPITAADDNHEKGFTTRSKMHIQFNDDTKTITIDTPAGNSIKLDEDSESIAIEDQNGNTAKLYPDGIDINSPNEINISASGDINIKSDMKINIEAGISMNAKATASMEIKGATTKVSADGITEVNGSMVKIN